MTAHVGAQVRLPSVCHATHPEMGGVVLIRRGEWGLPACRDRHDGRRLERFARSGPTVLQVEAMLIGSMFRWDVPGALPKMRRERDR